MPGAQPSTVVLRVALGSSGLGGDAEVQFRVSLNSKQPYGTAWLQSLSSIGKTRHGPILHPPPCSSRVLLHLPFLTQKEAGAGCLPCSEHAGTAPHSKLVPDRASAVR